MSLMLEGYEPGGKMRFEKISYEQWKKDYRNIVAPEVVGISDESFEAMCKETYGNIQLPKRATPGSAGYDFYLPYTVDRPYRVRNTINYSNADVTKGFNDVLMLPTGIRWIVENIAHPFVLKLYMRSSMGIKRNIRLANGTGIIDADYYMAENEGHIMIPIIIPSYPFKIDEPQTRIVQGIISNYYTVTSDVVVSDERNGGFGSTGE